MYAHVYHRPGSRPIPVPRVQDFAVTALSSPHVSEVSHGYAHRTERQCILALLLRAGDSVLTILSISALLLMDQISGPSSPGSQNSTPKNLLKIIMMDFVAMY
jgi:hypothetical protein